MSQSAEKSAEKARVGAAPRRSLCCSSRWGVSVDFMIREIIDSIWYSPAQLVLSMSLESTRLSRLSPAHAPDFEWIWWIWQCPWSSKASAKTSTEKITEKSQGGLCPALAQSEVEPSLWLHRGQLNLAETNHSLTHFMWKRWPQGVSAKHSSSQSVLGSGVRDTNLIVCWSLNVFSFVFYFFLVLLFLVDVLWGMLGS